MIRQLTLEEFLDLSKSGEKVSIFRELPSDTITPISAFQSLCHYFPEETKKGIALLESGARNEEEGHFSFLAFDFKGLLKAKGHHCIIERESGIEQTTKNPFELLKELLQEYHCVENPQNSSLIGGCVGITSYDAVRILEEIPDRHEQDKDLDDLFFAFPDVVIAFHHIKSTMTLSVSASAKGDLEVNYRTALERLDRLEKCLFSPIPSVSARKGQQLPMITTDLQEPAFCELVKKAQDYIKKGDAFQIVLSRSFQVRMSADPFDVYRALRFVNPSPFLFFFQMPCYSVAGASPERLVRVKNKKLETMPIAGTRPRGKTMQEDLQIEKDLLQDPKELAEHMMLVDLGRNDIGRMAQVGTVEVSSLKKIEKFSHVMHLVSEVKGDLKDGKDSLDALQSLFPASTLTGAPKIRAMQIIDELESTRRGLYGGAIVMIDNKGNLDSCIAIRMVVMKEGLATVRAGAGIVLDSDPVTEAQETYHKASGVIEAIRLAEEAKI